nr:Uncharacterised protein [Klebsiella pneumoniae]
MQGIKKWNKTVLQVCCYPLLNSLFIHLRVLWISENRCERHRVYVLKPAMVRRPERQMDKTVQFHESGQTPKAPGRA